MNAGDSQRILLQFVSKINEHDVKGLEVLMSDKHRFVDSLGESVVGRKKMSKGWKGYFAMFPDYHISIKEIFQKGPVFALFGVAKGTYAPDGIVLSKNRWKVPAAWRARIEAGRVSEWSVFADNYRTASLLKGE
jgi:SnoaL-like protein